MDIKVKTKKIAMLGVVCAAACAVLGDDPKAGETWYVSTGRDVCPCREV